MKRVLTGKVLSTKMQDTVIVEVTRRVPHKLYKKLMKRSKNYKVDSKGQTVAVGQRVKIIETQPLSKDKYFKLLEVIEK